MRTVLVLALVAGTACGPLPAATSTTPTSFAPPALVTPARPRRTKRYAAPMVAFDLLVLGTFLPVMRGAYDEPGEDGDAILVGYAAAYLFGGPLIHHMAGNERQVGSSLLRRFGYAGAGVLGGVVLGEASIGNDCSDECFLAPLLGGLLGLGAGAIVAAIHDWTKAHIDF